MYDDQHFYDIKTDPYVEGHWLATCHANNGTPAVYESHDDGETWSAEAKFNEGLHSTQTATGFDFGPDYICFADDSNATPYTEPWAYNRQTEDVIMLCRPPPKQLYPSLLGTQSEQKYRVQGYAIQHQPFSGEWFFDVGRELGSVYGSNTSKPLFRVPDVGTISQIVDTLGFQRPLAYKEYIFSQDYRYTSPNWGER